MCALHGSIFERWSVLEFSQITEQHLISKSLDFNLSPPPPRSRRYHHECKYPSFHGVGQTLFVYGLERMFGKKEILHDTMAKENVWYYFKGGML